MPDKDYYPPYRYFVCECDKEKEFHKPEELYKHVQEVHGVNIEGAKGTRELMMHLAKKPRHCASYRWAFDDLTLYEYYG